MSRPASLPPQRPFIGKNNKAGSQKLGLDFDHLDLSNNHRLEADLNLNSLQHLRRELMDAEARGAHSKAKKVRREINRQLEQGLLIQATFCGGCANVLHRCRCTGLKQILIPRKKKRDLQAAKEAAAVSIVHRILREVKHK